MTVQWQIVIGSSSTWRVISSSLWSSEPGSGCSWWGSGSGAGAGFLSSPVEPRAGCCWGQESPSSGGSQSRPANSGSCFGWSLGHWGGWSWSEPAAKSPTGFRAGTGWSAPSAGGHLVRKNDKTFIMLLALSQYQLKVNLVWQYFFSLQCLSHWSSKSH